MTGSGVLPANAYSRYLGRNARYVTEDLCCWLVKIMPSEEDYYRDLVHYSKFNFSFYYGVASCADWLHVPQLLK